MKIVRNTPTQLILADVPWLLGLGLILFILIFVGVGIASVGSDPMLAFIMVFAGGGSGAVAFAAFVRRTQLILDATHQTVTLRKRSLFGFREAVYPLNELTRAVTEGSISRKNTATRRSALVFETGMSKGQHPVTEVYTSGPGPDRATDTINEWLDAHRRSV